MSVTTRPMLSPVSIPSVMKQPLSADLDTLALRLGTLSTALLEDLERLLSGLDTAQSHGAESRAHTVGAVNLGQLHTADDQARGNFTGALDDGIFGGVHVKAAHATEGREVVMLHGDETLGGEGAEGA